tara:strand:- start:365 stop:772 length:408 start_codon:yes stop_codon:yes gene_type:complete
MNSAKGLRLFNATIFGWATLFLIVPQTNGQDIQQKQSEQIFKLDIKQRSLSDDRTYVRVKQGDKVRLHRTSDESVLLHIHGYDIIVSLSPEVPSEVAFKAHATGRFPVTSHGFGTPNLTHHAQEITLLYLEVHPN